MGIKRLGAQRMIGEFSGLEMKRNKKLSRTLHETDLLDILTRSGRPRTPRSCVVQRGAVTD